MVTVNMLSSRLLWWDDTWGTVNVPRYKTHDCTTQHTGLHTHCMFSVLMHVRIGAKKSKQQQTIQCRGLSHWYPHTHTAESPPLRLPALLFPFPALSFWHPSLSAAMDCETNFYHYTLQVKKGSWECVIYAGFDFYVASTGSSIIAPPGTLVHWAPDEMLSWHHYQSPRACPSPVPGVQEGACVVAAGLPPLLLPPPLRMPPWRWRQQSRPSVIWMVRWEHVFLYLGPSSRRDLCGSSFSEAPVLLLTGGNQVIIAQTRGKTRLVKVPPGATHPCSDTWGRAIKKTWGHAFVWNICKPQLYSQHEGASLWPAADTIIQYLRWKCLDGVHCFDLWPHRLV